MAQDEKDEAEEQQAFDADTDPEDRLNVTHQYLLVLDYSNQADKLCEFDQFVQPSELGKTQKLVEVRACTLLGREGIKGENTGDIDGKPAF